MQIQIAADLILLIALFVFFIFVNKSIKKNKSSVNDASIIELQKLLEDSNRLSGEFVTAVEEGRKSLKEIIYAIDEKEKRLKGLIEKAETMQVAENQPINDKKILDYEKVLGLADEGVTDAKIAELLDLTEGEIKLIRNLNSQRRKNIE